MPNGTTHEYLDDAHRTIKDLRLQLKEAKERAEQYAQDLRLSRDQRTALALDCTDLQAEIEGLKASGRKWCEAYGEAGIDIDKLKAEVEGLRGALVIYGEHRHVCILNKFDAADPARGEKYAGKWYESTPDCTCGFDTTLAQPTTKEGDK